nr:hypothetical protein Iba_chr11aCG0360 [Ipomoea batatas]GMD54892.1 hypothetical protein Iba_chr11dCG2730 [Ipomoea batatas]GMD56185.1 hypothetical protein Iba_chr11eCG0770 [Ipomoea batatas]
MMEIWATINGSTSLEKKLKNIPMASIPNSSFMWVFLTRGGGTVAGRAIKGGRQLHNLY